MFRGAAQSAYCSPCRSTLVCDGEEEAKRLAFDDPQQRRKVVTKAGLLISKSGAMTGGGSGELRGSRFDDAEYHRLKEVCLQVADLNVMCRHIQSCTSGFYPSIHLADHSWRQILFLPSPTTHHHHSACHLGLSGTMRRAGAIRQQSKHDRTKASL
jgi:hypothetical protein